ncbi:MAG: hypothetical protein ABSG97_09775, partial [Sedimentisphaerales bacterium]
MNTQKHCWGQGVGFYIVASFFCILTLLPSALFADSIVGWGDNHYGECNVPAGNNFIAIAAGWDYSLALKSDGSIVGWGDNADGECNVPAGNNFIAISAGEYHSLALKSDGSIVGWGLNDNGQATPPAGNNFLAIAAGWYHSLALKSDGSIVGWGYNYYGECNIPSPNSGFIAIAAGFYQSLALKSGGSILAWGDNSYGECNVPSPNSGFIAISAGYQHSLALKSDGSIVGWGNTAPPAGNNFIAIAAGCYHSLALRVYPIYVDTSATGANNGSSWADAYKYLQDALSAAPSGYEIWVAQGTYKPDRDTNHQSGTGDRSATFQLKNGVSIYGGFPSGGGSRDPNIYQTILSGDIGVAGNNSDNSYNVVSGSYTNSTAILDGFTITAGNATLDYLGGGMCNYEGSPRVTNCTFIGNVAYNGGMANYNGSPIITNCTFSGNSATSGGGIYNENSNPMLTNCTFNGNSSYQGGGMDDYNSSPTLTNCTFNSNSASHYGGGMKNDFSSPTLTGCNFSGNSAIYGGGMENDFSSPTLTGCNFSGDSATYGSGMYSEGTSVINVKAGGSNSTADEFYFTDDSQIRGTGSISIGLGGKMIIGSNAVVDLNDPNDPNIKGTIQCDGLLDVKGNGQLKHATVNVSRQAGGY